MNNAAIRLGRKACAVTALAAFCLAALPTVPQAVESWRQTIIKEISPNPNLSLIEQIQMEKQLKELDNFDGRSIQLEKYPSDQLTPELCEEAVSDSFWNLKHVPERLQTPEMQMEAVKQSGLALEFVPERAKTMALCQEAMRSNPAALRFVPDKFKTKEMILAAVQSDTSFFRVLPGIPERFRTEDVFIAAIKKHRMFDLDMLPNKYKTIEVCAWVLSDARNQKEEQFYLKSVPKEMQAKALQRAAEIRITRPSLSPIATKEELEKIIQDNIEIERYNSR